MKLKIRFVSFNIIIFSSLLLFWFCTDSTKYQEHESGLKYKLYKLSENGKKPDNDDVLVLRMEYRLQRTDSLLFSTNEFSHAFKMQMKAPSHSGGCVEDAFGLLSEGDSINFIVDAEPFYMRTKKKPIPSFIKKGDKLVFNLKLMKIIELDDYKHEISNIKQHSAKEEDRLLMNYIRIAGIEEEPSPTGLIHVVKKEGEGASPKAGNMVTVHYIGSFIDGQIFDSSYERHEPFKFKLGVGQVIAGLDEGVSQMKKGEKAKLVIPSNIAYGDKQFHNIPPYSTLIFDIELIDFK